MELEEAINKRKSIRHYKDGEVTQEEILKLIGAASNVPSAGHIHPLRIITVYDKDTKEKLCKASLNQRCIAEASVNLVIVADYNKITDKYHGRGIRYAQMEAGHMGQNISLMAVSLGLGTVMIGAFKDAEVKEVLEIKEDPLYVISVGRI